MDEGQDEAVLDKYFNPASSGVHIMFTSDELPMHVFGRFVIQ